MEIPTLHIFTHDSIGVGEDGPTYQPVEQLASLRAIPGLIVLRPPDANEVAEAWRVIMQLRHDPVVLVGALGTVRGEVVPLVEADGSLVALGHPRSSTPPSRRVRFRANRSGDMAA